MKSKFNFNKIKKVAGNRKTLNAKKYGNKNKRSPNRINMYCKKLPDKNVFKFNDFSGTKSKNSSVGRTKEKGDCEIMNVSAPVKISNYISNSKANMQKMNTQNNIFESCSPQSKGDRISKFQVHLV